MGTVAEEARLTPDELVAETICRELQYAGRSFQYGEYVAILDGVVIGVGESFEDVQRLLDERAPDPDRGLVVLVRAPEPDVVRPVRLPAERT